MTGVRPHDPAGRGQEHVVDPLVIALLVLAGVAVLVLLALVVQRRRRRGTLKVISAGAPGPAVADGDAA